MTPAGLDQLKLDEGLKLVAYPDPKSGGGPWTIGYGQTGSGIKEGTAWTKGQADDAILARVHLIEKQLSGQLNFFSKLNPVQQDVFVNIAYNIGVAGLLKWTITLAAARRGEISNVVANIRTNKVWRTDVGDRVDRCADAYRDCHW